MKKIFLNSVFIFLLATLIHFLYSTFPSFITSILAPVNESIFEHLKLIFTAPILFTFLSNIFYKEKNIFFLAFLRGILNIIILLILYLPIRFIFGEILLITLIVLFISILLSETIVSFLPNKKYSLLNFLSIFFIVLTYILFTYFSYHPPKNFLFYDTVKDNYGINK